MNTYKLTLISVLAALAVVGRFAFQHIPNVQPVTTLIIICGFFLGPVAAMILAVLTTYLSNLFLGMGIWTMWQIVAWALIGLGSGLIGLWKIKHPLYILVGFAVCSGFLYGLIVSLANLMITGKYLVYYFAGLPFDTYHAIGNGLFMIILYPALSVIFKRYNNRYVLTKIPTK